MKAIDDIVEIIQLIIAGIFIIAIMTCWIWVPILVLCFGIKLLK